MPEAIADAFRMQGFIVLDYADEFSDARRQLSQWISEGKIHTRATVVEGGLKVAEKALQGIFSGANTGELSIQRCRSLWSNSFKTRKTPC